MPDDNGVSLDTIRKKTPWLLIGVVTVLLIFVYALRGWGVIRAITFPFYVHIEIVWGLIVGTVLALGLRFGVKKYRGNTDENTQSTRSRVTNDPIHTAFVLTPYILVVIVVVALFMGLGTIYSQQAVIEDTNPDTLDAMHDPVVDDPRMLPMVTSDTYADNNMQMQTHTLSDTPDITRYEDRQYWAYSLEPEGLANRISQNQAGVILVNMSTMDTDVEVYEHEMQNGKGDWAHNSHDWNLYNDDYFVNYGDTYPVIDEDTGELYLVTPFTDYELEFRFPTFYHKPVAGGVTIMDSDGTIERVSHENAQNHDLLEGQRTYPYELAKYEVESQRYTNGIVNRFLYRDGVPEITDVEEEANEQPFYVNTQDGIKYVFVAEPSGEGGGVYQMWYYDAQTGETELYEPEETLMGPASAGGYVTGNMPIVSWDDRITSEPIPVSVNNEPYWMVRATPTSGSGVSFVAFVHAQDNSLVAFEDDVGVEMFLAGELTEGDDVEDMGTDAIEVEDQEVITSTITIIQDGEEQEINIDDDTQVIIEGDSGDGDGDNDEETENAD